MTEYVEDAGLNDALRAILTNTSYAEFAPLRDAKIKILPLLKVVTNNEGEHKPCKGCPVQAKKVSDLHKSAGIDADYLLVVDYYAWNHPKGINPQVTLDAMLHHALKSIKVEVKDGKAKLSKNDPDVEIFVDTVNRYGAFQDEIKTVAELVAAAPPVALLTEGEVGGEAAVEAEQGTEEEPAKPAKRKK